MKAEPRTTATRRRDGASALDSALRLLARRDHTCWELAFKLRQRGFDPAAVEAAMARCKDLGYLDDARTALTLAGHLVGRGYGRLRVRQMLAQKGLDGALIEKALACCGDEEAQLRLARRELEKRTSRFKREADPWRRRQAAYRFLAGRGFPAAVIHRAIADL